MKQVTKDEALEVGEFVVMWEYNGRVWAENWINDRGNLACYQASNEYQGECYNYEVPFLDVNGLEESDFTFFVA